ncbi:hypothetical protein N0V90_010595 [Kalmusia sp. IMI 367209]|nr:hypothetical protein N0V90_010595 [Kalmusia sp. IMI 367209]
MINSTVPKYSQGSIHGPENPDPEAQSTAPILSQTNTDRSSSQDHGSSNEQERKRNTYSGLPRVLDFFGGGIYAPGASTHDPIVILLNTEDENERDRLTENWRDNRLNELSFVGVVVSEIFKRIVEYRTTDSSYPQAALLAGVLTSTGSWPAILPNGKQSPWPVRTAWYCGIILSVFALLSAADQTVRLYRMSSHRDGRQQIRDLLAKSNGKRRTARLKPGKAQLCTWQMPVMFLTSAAICMITGLFLHVWSAIRHLDHESWWSDDAKVAVTFTVIGGMSIIVFFVGQITLYVPGA